MTGATASRTIHDPIAPGEPTRFNLRHRCVRCGFRAPAPDLFICRVCVEDPDTMREIRNVEEGFLSYERQRKVLTMFGWRGGWWR